MTETSNRHKVDASISRLNKTQNEQSKIFIDPLLTVRDNLKTQFDMWSWRYQQLSSTGLRMERLGFAVRINMKESPNYLEAYLAEIKSFLILIRPLIPYHTWTKLFLEKYKPLKDKLNKFFIIRRVVPTKKVPEDIIEDLDNLQGVALIIAQKKGMGVRIEENVDNDDAIDKAITGY